MTIVEDRNKAIFVTWNGVGEYGEGRVCVFMSARSARKLSVLKKIRLLRCRLYDIACFVQLVVSRACGVKAGIEAELTSSSVYEDEESRSQITTNEKQCRLDCANDAEAAQWSPETDHIGSPF